MIKKLRIKFVIASLLSILFVLVATIASINIYNYIKIQNEVEASLNNILSPAQPSDGPPADFSFPEFSDPNFSAPEFSGAESEGGDPFGPFPPGGGGFPPFEMRTEHFFLVDFDASGNVLRSDFGYIFFISEEEGIQMAKEVFNSSATSGKDGYFHYKKSVTMNVTSVAFVDAKEKYDSFAAFLTSSSIVSSISFAVLFVLILITSKVVFRVSEESYRKQKAFITNASHELKTPLTIISTDLELVEMDSGKSEWTDSIRDQVRRLTKMTNQMVALSRLDEGDYASYPFETISLTALANECVNSFAPAFDKEGFSLEAKIDEGVSINGNRFLLDELFSIFMDNALKYAARKGKVFVEVGKDKRGKAKIVFGNDVEKDAEIDVAQLFERFYRSPNSKKEGSGIGLSIAKEIVSLHKATIKAALQDGVLSFHIAF